MSINFCSRPIVNDPQVRVLLNAEQLEAIVLLLDQALAIGSFAEDKVNLEDTHYILVGLANALNIVSGKDLELQKYPGVYLPSDIPDAIEVIPSGMPVWHTKQTEVFFHAVANNLRLAISFGAVAIDRLMGLREPRSGINFGSLTATEWLEDLFLEAIAFSENRDTKQIEALTATAQSAFDRASAEYDRILNGEPPEEMP